MATAEMTAVLEMVETIHLNSQVKMDNNLKNQDKTGKLHHNKIILKCLDKRVLKSLSNLKNLDRMDKLQTTMVVMVALEMVETIHLKCQDKMGKSLNLVKAIDHQRELLDL